MVLIVVCPVTSLRRSGETSSMSSSRNSAQCCRATPGRWTSPPSCRKALTSCVNTKVGAFFHPHSLDTFCSIFSFFIVHSCVPCCRCLFTLITGAYWKGNSHVFMTSLTDVYFCLNFCLRIVDLMYVMNNNYALLLLLRLTYFTPTVYNLLLS